MPEQLPQSGIGQFLSSEHNSVSREVLFTHRITYELKLASAHSGFDLRVFRPDVDRDGFDLLLEQRSIVRLVQTKTVGARAKTSSWEVGCHLLHPSRKRAERLGFTLPQIGLGDGLDGAVLAIVFDVVGDDIQVRYRVFDLSVAAAHAAELTGLGQKQVAQVESLLARLRNAKGLGRVRVPRWMFLDVPTAEGVLALLGMRTRFGESVAYSALWSYALVNSGRSAGDGKPLETHAEQVRTGLAAIGARCIGVRRS